MIRAADISPCGQYRYRLTRTWGTEPPLTFCMLNPSTADAEQDDPTILWCMAFARREGAGGLVVVNLYALRATDPAKMLRHSHPVGPGQPDFLHHVASMAAANHMPIVCAWGAHARPFDAEDAALIFRSAGATLVCLGKTKSGAPRHPLYLPRNVQMVPWP